MTWVNAYQPPRVAVHADGPGEATARTSARGPSACGAGASAGERPGGGRRVGVGGVQSLADPSTPLACIRVCTHRDLYRHKRRTRREPRDPSDTGGRRSRGGRPVEQGRAGTEADDPGASVGVGPGPPGSGQAAQAGSPDRGRARTFWATTGPPDTHTHPLPPFPFPWNLQSPSSSPPPPAGPPGPPRPPLTAAG